MSLESNEQDKRFTNRPFVRRITFKFGRKAQQAIGASRTVLQSRCRSALLAPTVFFYKIIRAWLSDQSRTMGSYHTAACLVWGLLLTGCTQEESALPKTSAAMSCFPPAAEREVVVGVAFSGGGSRAALFGAAGLEELGKLRAPQGGSVLEKITYLSSVSGGGLAAAYYALHKPQHETPVLTRDGKMTAGYQKFFTDFKNDLAQDFEKALLWHQVGSFRFNSTLAARSLEEILKQDFLGPDPFTFNELSARQMRGDSPRVIFNTTLYNDGRPFLFTNILPNDVQYHFMADSNQSLKNREKNRRKKTRAYPDVVKNRWAHLLPVTPLELQINPCPVPVAEAVAASASAPPFLGPFIFHVGEEYKHWHVGDGALYENLGLESLMFVLLKQLQDKKVHRALIISFNSGFPFSVGVRILGRRSEPWNLFNYDYTRIPGIMEERATNYWSLFFRSLQVKGVIPGDRTLDIVFLNHEEAEWKEDLSDLPKVCNNEKPRLASPEDVQERVASIPTRFTVVSECDRELLFKAAEKVVKKNEQKIADFLAEPQTAEKTARRRVGDKRRKK